MSRGEQAKELFMQGYACSQAVALAFSDVMGMDEDTISKIALPFGGGLGRLRLTCGAVSGMAMVVGMACATAENSRDNKAKVYEITRLLCQRFKEQCGSLICADLLKKMDVSVEVGGQPQIRDEAYYQKRTCADTVYIAAEIVEEYLRQEHIL